MYVHTYAHTVLSALVVVAWGLKMFLKILINIVHTVNIRWKVYKDCHLRKIICVIEILLITAL